jgi:protein-S-isoprenylcysteine O-methyltransferase Ste14
VSDAERWAYAYALVPAAVVLAVGPTLAALAPGATRVDPGPVGWTGLPAVVAGLGLVVVSLRAFARAGTTPSPAERPDRLVTGGPLAHTRNPIYLGTVLATAGEALALGSAVVAGYAGALWTVYHLLVVYREEPALATAFGDDYEAYREQVPRWVPVPSSLPFPDRGPA